MATSALAALSATTAAAAGKRILLSRPAAASSSFISFASHRLATVSPLQGFLGVPIWAMALAAATKTIAVGDWLPDVTLSYFETSSAPDGELKTVTVHNLTMGKKVVLFSMPGTFTANCTQKHLPWFMACVSVNDAFVMRMWKENLGVGDKVLLMSDGNGELAHAVGIELDLSSKPMGLSIRSQRYALLAEDGVVKVLNLEEGSTFTNSSVEDMLKAL